MLRQWVGLVTAVLHLGGCAFVPRSAAIQDSSQVQHVCPDARTDLERGPRWTQLSLNGRVLPPTQLQAGTPRSENPPELAHLSADSIFDFVVVTDSARLAELGFCRGVIGGAITTVAEARRLGLRPAPPQLCVEPVRYTQELAVGDTLRLRSGQLDILRECDRPSPGVVQWRSSDEAVLGIDATGLVIGRRPGAAEAIAFFDGVEARIRLTVRPRQP